MRDAGAIELIKEINEIREDVNVFAKNRAPLPEGLYSKVEKSVLKFSDGNVAHTFLKELRAAIQGKWDFAKTREVIDREEGPFIIGVFYNPYNPLLALDCIVCKQHAVDTVVFNEHPGKFSRVISVNYFTDGFKVNSCVALFAEHYISDTPVREHNKACYFVDRFRERFCKITTKILDRCVEKNSLIGARKVPEKTVQDAFCVWLHLHEYAHRLGNMPLPDFLDFKTPRNAASIEELRVDVLTVIFCLEIAESGYEAAQHYAEIIFAERCFRYATQYDLNDNYDARGCAILFSYLLFEGVIRVSGHDKISVNVERLLTSLRAMIQRIDYLEERLRAKSREENVNKKTQFVEEFLVRSDLKYKNPQAMKLITERLEDIDLNFEYA